MGNNRIVTSVLTISALALSLTACSGGGNGPEDAAQSLADGLGRQDVSASSFTGDTAEDVNTELAGILAGMDPLDPEVRLAGVSRDEDSDDAATARLAYSWDLNADSQPDWTYETTAGMERTEDGQWQVAWTPAIVHSDLTDGVRMAQQTSLPPRADITGANGQSLVTARPVLRVGIDKTLLEPGQEASSAAALAALVGLDPAAYTASVEAAGAEAFVEALIQREEADGPATDEGLAAIPGAVALPDTRQLAPTRTFARALLGSSGEATAELIEESEGRLSPGDVTGLSGLQQQYDAQLAGTKGVDVVLRDDPAGTSEPLFGIDPVPGTPLRTSLDARLQQLAETVLEEEPSASAIVAIRPSTGEVVTAANGPGSEGQQTALLGQYPAGSTLKIATSLALLRTGITPDSTLECPEEVLVDGRRFNNASTYPSEFVGGIPLRAAFAQSCNTAFINARDDVPQAALSAAAADLGIGVDAALGTPAFFGSVPAEASGTTHAASLIGQGEVLVSPLSLAVAGASVARGERISPVLVSPESAAGPSAAPDASASPAPGKLTAEEATTLRELMRRVVTDGGGKLLLDLPAQPVLAKTGTAEFGSETPPRTHAWVVAIQGDLAVTVFVAEGELGSTSGGPLMRAFLEGAQQGQ